MAHTRVQTAWDLYDQDESGYAERKRREEAGRPEECDVYLRSRRGGL
jgi:hypothetical protein